MTLKRDEYGIARVEKGNLEAWNQGNGWRITDNGYTVVTFWLDETRERKTDWSGQRKYRVVTKQKAKFEFRLSYGVNITIDDGCEFYSGEGETVRRIIELYEDGWFERQSKWAAERMARDAGASGRVYEPTIDQLRDMMVQARNERPMGSKAIQITGGEPTIREDL